MTAPAIPNTLIARPHMARELANGMRLTDYNGLNHHISPYVEMTAETLSRACLVVLCVKGPATQTAIEQIALHAPLASPVLSLQNGLAPVRELSAAMPDRVIIPGMVSFNVARRGPTHWHKGSAGQVIAERHWILDLLATPLGTGPAALKLVDDMAPIQWGKLLLNLNNAINALSGLTLRAQLGQYAYRRVLAAAIKEALDLMDYAGIRPATVGATTPQAMVRMLRLPDILFRNIALRLQRIDAHARSSMADDFAAGKPSEINALNGEIVHLAEAQGRRAPINAALVDLVMNAENGGQRQFSGPELVAAVKLHSA